MSLMRSRWRETLAVGKIEIVVCIVLLLVVIVIVLKTYLGNILIKTQKFRLAVRKLVYVRN